MNTHENMSVDQRTCLVTGGAGFVGSHLCDALLAAGHKVRVVDNLSTGRAGNIKHLPDHPNFEFFQQDITDKAGFEPHFNGVDDVYHLASYVGVKLASVTSSQTILNNLRSIDIILELVSKYNTKLLLTSTSEIYGKALDVIEHKGSYLHEDSDRVYGSTSIHRWSYAGIKAVEEFLTLAKHHEEGFHAVIVRLFNVIGPRQIGKHGPVVPRFIDQALDGEELTVYGDGSQRRCFTDIRDAIQAIVALMGMKESAGQAYNIGGSEPITMLELASIVNELTGNSAGIKHMTHEQVFGNKFEDVNLRIPATEKLDTLLQNKIQRDVRDIIKNIIDHHPTRSS